MKKESESDFLESLTPSFGGWWSGILRAQEMLPKDEAAALSGKVWIHFKKKRKELLEKFPFDLNKIRDLVIIGSIIIHKSDSFNTEYENSNEPSLIIDALCYTKDHYKTFTNSLLAREPNHTRAVWAITIQSALERSKTQNQLFEHSLIEIIEAADFAAEADEVNRLPQISEKLPEQVMAGVWGGLE